MQLANVLYFLLWAGLFVVMMRFGCGAHVMGHRHHGRQPQTTPPDKAVDPVCGKSVETSMAKSTLYRGVAYYCCSQACREKFEAAPDSYLGTNAAAANQGEAHHGCH